jgi:hypothetical protein
MSRGPVTRGVVQLVLLMAALAAIAPPPAQAVSQRSLKALRQAPCPPEYLPGGSERTYSAADREDALENDRYRIVADWYAVLKPPNIDWNQDPHNSQSWRNSLAELNWIKILYAIYLESPSASERRLALEKARDLVLDWIRNQPRGGPTTSPSAWRTKSTGDRLAQFAYLARAASCEDLLTVAESSEILDAADAHGRWTKNHRVPNNHGLFDSFGLVAASQQLPFMQAADDWRKVGKRNFGEVAFGRVARGEGIWLDQSSQYHFASTAMVNRFLTLNGTRRPSLKALRRRMEDSAAWLVEQPDGRRVQWGDSNAAQVPDKYVRDAADDRGLKAMLRSGLAFVREGGAYLSVLASYHNKIHKHSDDLSFGIFDHGHQIVSDTGDFERDPSAIRAFELSPQAHSTLTVDGGDFPRDDRNAYGSGLAATGSDGHWRAVLGANPLLKARGVGHRRWIVYKPGVAAIIVDRVRSPKAHTYDRFFHFGPDVTVGPVCNSLGVPVFPAGTTLQLSAGGFDGAVFDNSSVPSSIETVRGRDAPNLQGWTYPEFEQRTARCTARYTASAADADFVASLALTGADTRAALVGPAGRNKIELALRTGSGAGSSAGRLEIKRDDARLRVRFEP